MKISIEIPEYNIENGFKFKWEDNFTIKTTLENKKILISANEEGLVSLANHLLNLAQKSVPSNYHIHLDDSNSLEKGSAELIIQKE